MRFCGGRPLARCGPYQARRKPTPPILHPTPKPDALPVKPPLEPTPIPFRGVPQLKAPDLEGDELQFQEFPGVAIQRGEIREDQVAPVSRKAWNPLVVVQEIPAP